MRVREIVGDTQSAEIQQMRRSFNSLLRIIENVATLRVATTIDAAETWLAIRDALVTGLDSDNSPYLGTGQEMVGIRVTPTARRKAQANARVVEDDLTDA